MSDRVEDETSIEHNSTETISQWNSIQIEIRKSVLKTLSVLPRKLRIKLERYYQFGHTNHISHFNNGNRRLV